MDGTCQQRDPGLGSRLAGDHPTPPTGRPRNVPVHVLHGDVDVNDLNNVFLDWGTDGSANGGDLTGSTPGSPPDGTVDVNDLNAVIVNWGVCP